MTARPQELRERSYRFGRRARQDGSLGRNAAGVLIAALLSLPAPMWPDPAQAAERMALGSDRLKIGFEVRYLSLLTVEGAFVEAWGELYFDERAPERSTLKVVTQTASIRTGSAVRDRALTSEQFFDAQRFPNVIFQASTITMTGPRSGRAIGDLTMVGVTRPVALEFVLRRPSDAAPSDGAVRVPVLEARGIIRRSDWGMTSLFPAVSDEVGLSIQIRLDGASR